MRKFILLSQRFDRNRPWATSMTSFKMDSRPMDKWYLITCRRKPRQKTALQSQFPRFKFKLRLVMRFLNRQNIKKNGLLICSRTGDSKEMRKSVIVAVLPM